MSEPRCSFTPDLNHAAVDLLRRSKKSQTQVAWELGIAQTTLNRLGFPSGGCLPSRTALHWNTYMNHDSCHRMVDSIEQCRHPLLHEPHR